MSTIATTKMSSKGQVVIPESIRDQLSLGPGTQFVVLGQKDTVILKSIQAPPLEEFSNLRKNLRRQVKKIQLKKTDVTKAIRKARKKK
ncbi:MAG: AbrB/MazE/SpoVT family DNA-binding domain-containing protein [Bacteriovoracales bacterium]|nr:AbrB/MazE/SpoVT family DNA-binding domain-containing protein [Bacteriovoracales bacterium]